ncbi:MAG: DUF2520 domain-containing protein [Bacteroidales bacterium]|nr:DUF2520 domain-containing protein [Bacteroidales bacterium]
MQEIKSVFLFGSGRVATQMAVALKQAGIELKGVYSKSYTNALVLAEKVDCIAIQAIEEIPSDADAYLFAVLDTTLGALLNNFNTFEGILLHTSGSLGLNVFSKRQKNVGVFYPLQTFTKEKPLDFKSIPLLIESDNDLVLRQIHALAEKISNSVKVANSVQRKQIHLAAVFANNFSNHMIHLSQKLMDDHGLDFNLLKPLIKETFQKLETIDPAQSQTGPAIRGDETILAEHLNLLNDKPEIQQIYQLLSDSIKKNKL